MHLPCRRRSSMPSHFGHCLAYITVIFVTIISPARCVSVDGIVLAGGGRYAQLHDSALLHCPHTPLEGAALEKLGWFKEGVPVMTWAPPDAPVASVEYHDRLNASVVDGSLALLQVSTNDGGPYTCTVQTSDGKQATSEPYHLTVADVPSFGFSMQGNVADCTLHFSFSSPPIYPKPTPLCGVWSTDTLYTGTATDWQAVPYYNGSVAYSIVDTTFPVRGMPLQAGIRCELSFPPAEGTANDDRVVAWTNTAYYPQVSERGCPPLEVGDGIGTHYTNHRTTCRGELAAQDPSKQLVAMISCMTGKRSSLRGGAMGSLQLQCAGGQQWEPVGGVSWDEFENMECTDDLNSGHEDESLQQLSQPDDLQEYEDQESPVAEPDSGAAGLRGVTTAAVAAAMLVLLM